MAVALTIVKPVRVYSTPSFCEGMRDLGVEGGRVQEGYPSLCGSVGCASGKKFLKIQAEYMQF